MTDRNVQFPNRYRMVKVAGTDDIFDVIPAPGEVFEEGTFLNKASLLSDETAALYGKDDTAAPDDVLAAIPDKISSHDLSLRTFVQFSESGSWQPPKDIANDEIFIVCVGAGGGYGGIGSETSLGSYFNRGGDPGGGGSGYISCTKVRIDITKPLEIVVGAGGTGGKDGGQNTNQFGTDGTSGGFSSVTQSGKTLCIAQGGKGGKGGAPATSYTGGRGGDGGDGMAGGHGGQGGTCPNRDNRVGGKGGKGGNGKYNPGTPGGDPDGRIGGNGGIGGTGISLPQGPHFMEPFVVTYSGKFLGGNDATAGSFGQRIGAGGWRNNATKATAGSVFIFYYRKADNIV